MGCDFSSALKQNFTQRISNLKRTSSEIEKKQNKLKSSLKEYNEITPLPTEKNNLIRDLEKSLFALENILKDVKERQVLKSSDTISIEAIQKSPEHTLSPEKVTLQKTRKPKRDPFRPNKEKEKEKEEKPNKQEKRESVSKLTQQSILNDPEIAALIAKNRKLLIRQLTR